MTWRPEILHPEKNFMHEAYGITEELRLELSAQMDDLMKGPIRIMSLHGIVDDLATIAQSKEEFAWCVLTHTWLMAQKNMFL